MTVSGLLLLMTSARLWSGCVGLPAACSVQQLWFSRTAWVHCSNTNLTAIPDDIPANAEEFTLSYSDQITNISHIPPLTRLRKLDLNRNSIQVFSWLSLRALPNLEGLFLMGNRLRYVKLDTVIEHLPKLKKVDLRFNKLASFSESELGRPQVAEAWINGNPFRCDCDLSWLIDKLACFQACQGKQQACCLHCSACFVVRSLELGAHVCHSPPELTKLHLSDVSTRLTGCEAHQPHPEPTTAPTAIPVTSVVIPTDGTLQCNKTSLSTAPTSPAETIATSLLNTTGTRITPEDYKLPVLNIILIVMGTLVAMALIIVGSRLLYVKINTTEGAVNHGHQPVNHGHQPVNHGHQPVNHGHQPVNHRHQPVNHGHQPVNHAHQPVNHGHQPVNHGHQPVNHGHQPVNHGHQPVNHGHQLVNEIAPPTGDHIYENPLGALEGGDSAVMDGGPSAAPPTYNIPSTDDNLDWAHGAVRGGTETMSMTLTANRIYSTGHGTDIMMPITNRIYSTEEDLENGTETVSTTPNNIYSTEGMEGGHETATSGTEAMTPITNPVYSIEDDLDNGTETAQTTNQIYSIE